MFKRLKASRKQQRQREETTRFLNAARAGELEKVLEFVRSNFDINARNEDDLSAIHLASKEGHVEIVRELLRRGANVDSITKKGNTSLHMSCMAGQLEIVRVLVEQGASVNAQSKNGFTPLYVAAQENRDAVIEFLFSHGADASLRADGGFLPLDIALQKRHGKAIECILENDPTNKTALPALHMVAKNNDVKLANFLLDEGYDVNGLSPSGYTALHIASHYGNYEVSKTLIERGAEVTFKAKNDITPLHVASKQGHSSIVELLIRNGAQLDGQTMEGLTALHCAAVGGHDQTVDTLVRSGASLSSKTKNGLTPLHMALEAKQASSTRQLLQYNAPIDEVTEDNLTPLHLAVHWDNLRSTEILLDAGCDVTAKTKNGFTPLHIACKRNHREIAELLQQHGADVKEATDAGFCPLHVAAFMGHSEVMTFLIQHGAGPDGQTKRGMTPLYLATLANRPEAVVELLLKSGATADAMTTDKRTALHVASEFGNVENVRQLLEHGASTGMRSVDGLLPLDCATRAGSSDIVRLLMEHGALKDEGPFQKSPSKSLVLEEFSVVREELRYLKDEEDGIKTPKLRRKALEPFLSATPSSRSSPFGRESRLSQTHSSVVLPDSPSMSFWASFLIDARGGEMIGCRHSGVRIILPPSNVSRPMGITCKLIRKEKLPFPPPVKEGEALACRAVETSPAGSEFLGPVIFEVPHFASLRGGEREIAILRSDNGRSWSEHTPPPLEDMEPALKDSLRNELMLRDNSLVHIITVQLPRFFALITRIRMDCKDLSTEGGLMTSTLFPKVKISFPEESFQRKTKVGLQAQPVAQDLISKTLGDQSRVSPIVTIEPRRRKFHHPVSMTIPLPDDAASAESTRLFCSISGSNNPALWEDITDLTPVASANQLLSFRTAVSGKYWLVASPNVDLSLVQKLYSLAVAVPFLGKFVVFAKRQSLNEGRLRIFCMTDDKVDKTLERQEHFTEVARSDDVEVLEGTAQYVHMEGNLLPLGDVSKLHLNFHAFRENRLPVAVRVVDPSQEAGAFLSFLKDPGARASQLEICTLRVTLPEFKGEASSDGEPKPISIKTKEAEQETGKPDVLKAELRMKDIAESIGDDWKKLAGHLGIAPEEVERISSEYDSPTVQALAMLQQWVKENGSLALGNRLEKLEKALRELGMDDVIASCMCNIADVTDAEEKDAARRYKNAGVDSLKADLGALKEVGSSRASSVRHSLSPDVAFEEEALLRMGLHSPDGQTDKSIEGMFRESRVGERFPFIDRSISTVSTTTLTTLPSDGGDTMYQSVEEIMDEEEMTLNTEVEEEEQILEDGSCVKRKIVTIRHFRHRKGSEDVLAGVEVEEDILELPPGVQLPLGDDVEVEEETEDSSEYLPGGVLLKKKVRTQRVRKSATDHGIKNLPHEGQSFVPGGLSSNEPSPVSPSLEKLPSVGDICGGKEQRLLSDELREDVPVTEEELVEEKARQAFHSLPLTAPRRESRGHAEEEGGWHEGRTEDELHHEPKIHEVPYIEFDIYKEKAESTADGKIPLEKHARVTLRKRIHKKTVITAGCQEETIVTEDTHVEQDDDTPKELSSAIRLIIEQFVQGKNGITTTIYGAERR